MIGSIRGTVIDRMPSGEVIVDVGGVGYRATVPAGTLISLAIGDEAMLHTHLHVREDAMILYGFATRDERICFEALLGAHGVGPALALAILSVHAPGDLREVLASDDVAALCTVPGVGKKTAQRLLLELKNRLDVPDLDLSVGADDGTGDRSASGDRRLVREALAELGYGPDEIREALADLAPDGDAEDLLRQALKRLAVSA